jgi:hypothetical protein
MWSSAVRVPYRRWTDCRQGERRTIRPDLRCDLLESRQLLSIGQAGASALVPPSPHVPAAQVSSPLVASNVNASVSNEASIANQNQLGTAGGADSAQVGLLITNPATATAGLIATTETLTTNPQSNVLGANSTLTNLSVSVLNPADTSTEAAIIDTQVDSDAFLVPSATDLLDDHLGRVFDPAAAFSGMLGTGNGSGSHVSGSQGSGSSAVSSGPSAVSSFGQSAPPGLKISTLSPASGDSVEPVQPGAPTAQPAAPTTVPQPAQPAGKAPESAPAPQPAQPAGKAPEPAPAPQPAPPDGKPPAPAASPSSDQSGEQVPAQETTRAPQFSPVGRWDIDAVLELTDVRALTRSREGNMAQWDDPLTRVDTSQRLAACFAAAMVAWGGYRRMMHNDDRNRW